VRPVDGRDAQRREIGCKAGVVTGRGPLPLEAEDRRDCRTREVELHCHGVSPAVEAVRQGVRKTRHEHIAARTQGNDAHPSPADEARGRRGHRRAERDVRSRHRDRQRERIAVQVRPIKLDDAGFDVDRDHAGRRLMQDLGVAVEPDVAAGRDIRPVEVRADRRRRRAGRARGDGFDGYATHREERDDQEQRAASGELPRDRARPRQCTAELSRNSSTHAVDRRTKLGAPAEGASLVKVSGFPTGRCGRM
jgi:hypothetical protein